MRTLEEIQNDRGFCECGCGEPFKYNDDTLTVRFGSEGCSQGYPENYTQGEYSFKEQHVLTYCTADFKHLHEEALRKSKEEYQKKIAESMKHATEALLGSNI